MTDVIGKTMLMAESNKWVKNFMQHANLITVPTKVYLIDKSI